jgi:hypothetical protein
MREDLRVKMVRAGFKPTEENVKAYQRWRIKQNVAEHRKRLQNRLQTPDCDSVPENDYKRLQNDYTTVDIATEISETDYNKAGSHYKDLTSSQGKTLSEVTQSLKGAPPDSSLLCKQGEDFREGKNPVPLGRSEAPAAPKREGAAPRPPRPKRERTALVVREQVGGPLKELRANGTLVKFPKRRPEPVPPPGQQMQIFAPGDELAICGGMTAREGFDTLYGIWPKKDHYKRSWDAFVEVLSSNDAQREVRAGRLSFQKIIDAATYYRDVYAPPTPIQYIPFLENWLRDWGWNNRPLPHEERRPAPGSFQEHCENTALFRQEMERNA